MKLKTITAVVVLCLLPLVWFAVPKGHTQQEQSLSEILLIYGGRYYLITEGPQIREIARVITFNGETPPPPIPQPPQQSDREQVSTWAKQAADPLYAMALAKIYELVAVEVQNGTWTFDQAKVNLGKTTDEILNTHPNKAGWETFRNNVTDLIRSKDRRGELATKAQQVKFLEDVRDGLTDASGSSQVDLAKLIELILKIIEFLKSLKGDDAAIVPSATPTQKTAVIGRTPPEIVY